MDPRNFKITNLKQKRRRINPDSSTDDLNENDVDFDVQLEDDRNGNPVLVKLDNCAALESQKIITIDYLSDKKQTVQLDDLVCKDFRGKSTFKLILSLSYLHKYRYEIELDKGKELTYRRLFKIICHSAKTVLKDTLEFLGGSNKSSPDIIGDEDGSEDDVPTENNSNNDLLSGGFMGNLYKKIFGGAKLFDIHEKLSELEVEYIGVQKESNRIFVEFTGFDKDEEEFIL